MSSSATDPTSTIASSTSSACDQPASERAIEVVACGALAAHIRAIAARRGWPVTVRPLPAALHNRPEKITAEVERELVSPRSSGSRAVIGYADCGSYGAVSELAERSGARHLPGLHCYDLYAGAVAIERIFAEEPGTYLLTDYLIKTFERTVIHSLGLERYPQLWTDYFGHYKRLVWLAQQPTPALEAAAAAVADRFKLPLTRIDTGLHRLETALAELLEESP